MIHVTPQPEPEDFDRKVRQRGLAWLRKKGIDPNAALPVGTKLPAYWRDELDELYTVYGKCCAYLAVFLNGRQEGGLWIILPPNPSELIRPMSGAITGWPARG